jgi:ferrous iron transport protein B
MPSFKLPMVKNVAITVLEKTKAFVVEAGKIILAISVVIWVLASNGPGESFNNASTIVQEQYEDLNSELVEQKIAAHKLEYSYIGLIGKSIEPIIRPLGYDWKIGIGLVTSFAAREVFVGTLATIYSVGGNNPDTLKQKMSSEKREDGSPVFTLASGISLLLFYAFAMQCMSTLAVVRRETNSWKWPIIQLIGMTFIAYVISLIAYQLIQ